MRPAGSLVVANPDDEPAAQLRAEFDVTPLTRVRHHREYLGWGVFALMDR